MSKSGFAGGLITELQHPSHLRTVFVLIFRSIGYGQGNEVGLHQPPREMVKPLLGDSVKGQVLAGNHRSPSHAESG